MNSCSVKYLCISSHRYKLYFPHILFSIHTIEISLTPKRYIIFPSSSYQRNNNTANNISESSSLFNKDRIC